MELEACGLCSQPIDAEDPQPSLFTHPMQLPDGGFALVHAVCVLRASVQRQFNSWRDILFACPHVSGGAQYDELVVVGRATLVDLFSA